MNRLFRYTLMVGMMSVADNMTIALYSEKWLSIVPFVYIVCIEAMISVVGTVTLQAIKSYGRSDLMLKMEFIKKPIMLVSLLIAMKFGIYAIALTLPLNTILELIINGSVVKRLIGYNLKSQLFDCIPELCYSIIMGIISYSIGYIECNLIVLLILQIVGGFFAYMILSIIFKDTNFLVLKKCIQKMLIK